MIEFHKISKYKLNFQGMQKKQKKRLTKFHHKMNVSLYMESSNPFSNSVLSGQNSPITIININDIPKLASEPIKQYFALCGFLSLFKRKYIIPTQN